LSFNIDFENLLTNSDQISQNSSTSATPSHAVHSISQNSSTSATPFHAVHSISQDLSIQAIRTSPRLATQPRTKYVLITPKKRKNQSSNGGKSKKLRKEPFRQQRNTREEEKDFVADDNEAEDAGDTWWDSTDTERTILVQEASKIPPRTLRSGTVRK